jgi:hypothetical protein
MNVEEASHRLYLVAQELRQGLGRYIRWYNLVYVFDPSTNHTPTTLGGGKR